MELKRYLILDAITHKGPTPDELKLKVVRGFLRSEISDIFDINNTFTALGDGKDRLYFFPGCSVPRFKVRTQYAVTIKLANATAAFISKTGLTGSETLMTHHRNLMPISEASLTPFMVALNQEYSRAKDLYITLVNANSFDGIFITRTLWWERSYSKVFGRIYMSNQMYTDRHTFKNECDKDQYQLLSPSIGSDLYNVTCPIYDESALLKFLNVGNIVLTEDKYQELRSFGKTGTDENMILMMELMCNCDFEKSMVPLLFLLKEFGKEIVKLKQREHVNFKSLLTFMDLADHNLSEMSIHRMTITLQNHHQFTQTNALKLSKLFAGSAINFNQQGSVWMQGPVLSNLDLLNPEV